MVLCCILHGQVALASLAGVSPQAYDLPIGEISIIGNNKTREDFVLDRTGLRPGLVIDEKMLVHARQELLDTDLFKSVEFEIEQAETGIPTLRIVLEERKFWLLLPRVNRNSEGDVKAGFRLRMYNLQGSDQTLEMLVQKEEEADGDESDEFRFRYHLPMLRKPYDLRWSFNRVVTHTEVEDFENVEIGESIGMSVSRDWHTALFETPLTLTTGLTLESRQLDRPYPDDLEAIEAGKFNRIRLGLSLDDLHSEKYRRYGSSYSIAISRGFEWLGSDYDSDIFEFVGLGFRPLNRYDNINYRLVLEVSNDSPFNYPNYSIGGGSSLRGLEDFDERGDALFFTNLEYVYSYRSNPGLSHTLFVDFGNIYEDLNGIDLTDFQYTVGTGFRWKIQTFVKTDLFLDYGYDLERNIGKLYGGTSLNF